MIREGFHQDLDYLRGIMNGGNQIIEKMEQSERERTGIKGLKIGFNRVFGYYIEVTRSYYDLVPDDYVRKQTLTNCERFITPDLKKTENDILSAKEKALGLPCCTAEAGTGNRLGDCTGGCIGSVRICCN